MMMNKLFLPFFILLSFASLAQHEDSLSQSSTSNYSSTDFEENETIIPNPLNHLSPEVDYRSVLNPHYWKNNPPDAAYWQQDVHYTIEASIDDEKDMIDGSLNLKYYNNSPHTLPELYFHLHQNAFIPGSYYHNLNINNKVAVKFGKSEIQGLGTIVDSMTVNGKPVLTEIDNTIMKVYLHTPLQPGESLEVNLKFQTYFDPGGTLRRRMKEFVTHNTKHFDGVQWYPAIAVYDQKFGWNTDQDLDKEYYGNFGTFDVRLTFPQEYVVEATGLLQNKEEVLPDSLRAALDLANFIKKSPSEAPSVIVPKVPGKTKTWYFHAKNVHNFAFTADPLYRIGELEWNGIRVVALAQEHHAAGWQQSAWFTLNVINVYSTDFGMYAWPKIIVADAKDGMEYPMLTLDNGTYPQHQNLIAHEVGHMWFYGMLGSNETYRAFMDEGFTQFLTVWCMDKLVGEKRERHHPNKFINKFLDSSDTRYENLYYPYLNHVTEGFDEPLNTHSSAFNGAIRHGGNYGLTYYKTGVMLYNLKYVLGDELFLDAMKYYVQKWKFKHPYPEDFRQAIIEYTKTDLNWFFDQWLETTKYIDYSVKEIYKGEKEGEYEITFLRKGRMQMPIEFTVVDEKGFKYNYYIPNTWFIKNTDAVVLPKWYGWDLLQPEYTAKIKLLNRIKYVQIDPSHTLADADLSNNSMGYRNFNTWQFDHRIPLGKKWTKAENFARPDLWYNSFDGVQLGANIHGSYFNKYTYSLSMWGNTGLFRGREYKEFKRFNQPVAFNFSHTSNLSKLWVNTSVYEYASYNAGLFSAGAGIEKIFRKQDNRNPRYSKIFIEAKYLINSTNINYYLLYPGEWGSRYADVDRYSYVNATLNIGFFRQYVYKNGVGEFTFSGKMPSFFADYNYSGFTLNSINKINLKKFELKTRLFGKWLFGEIPKESAVYLAGANPEELAESKFTRARGLIPTSWLGYGNSINHFHQGGGLNLRGYAGYLAPEASGTPGYRANGGVSTSFELDFDNFIKIKPKGIVKNIKIDTYLFGDMGVIADGSRGYLNMGRFRMDAGLGTAINLRFSPYDIKPLVLRFDMPLILNSPSETESYFKFRYVVGINRAF